MPHIVVEYSANVGERIAIEELIKRVHETALRTGVFPVGGTRTRAAQRSSYRIADGHSDNGFVHVVMRIAHGRDLATRRRVGDAVFAELCGFLEPLFARAPLGISLEIQEIDPELSWKKNNLHDYVKKREAKP